MALLMPVMLALVAGVFDVGLYLHSQAVAVDAAQLAARAASFQATPAAMSAVALTTARGRLGLGGFDTSAVTVDVSLVGSGPSVVEVALSVPFHSATGITPLPATMQTHASVRWEGG